MTVLYITHNGVTDHIGRSQVAPYVLGLARQGFRIHVLSAEKGGRDALIGEYQQLFDQAGVRWTRVRYRSRPPVLGQVMTQAVMKRAARRIIKLEGIRVLHCRSFPAALIAYALKPRLGIRYIFDFRDFSADGGIQKFRGLKRLVFRRLKQLEGPMIRRSDKVVCLTDRARELLTAWYLHDDPDAASRFRTIPCCADFSHFDPDRVSAEELDRARARAGLRGDEDVLLYLGSLGPDYLLSQMMALFRQMLAARPDARFLFVSNNGRELVELESQLQGLAAERIAFVSADRREVPAFLRLATLSVVFIRADTSKAGCFPTKLAELLACNIPVIANTGVGDLDAIIDPDRNGSVIVTDFDDASLRRAVEDVLERLDRFDLRSIRESSREFALEEGVARYAAIYKELLGD